MKNTPLKSTLIRSEFLLSGTVLRTGLGFSYEATYLAILERLLNRHGKHFPHFEVIKMGIPRYFPEAERLVLQHYGIQYEPDLILVAFLANDVIDTSQGIDAVAVSSNGNLISDEAAFLGDVGMWFYKNAHLGRLLLNRLMPKISSVRHHESSHGEIEHTTVLAERWPLHQRWLLCDW